MKSYGGAVAFFLVFTTIHWGVDADVVSFQPCIYPDANAPTNCTIHELRVNPCKEAAQGKPCRIKRGLNATIDFDYTPDFEAETLEGRAYWVNEVLDVPFLGMETNACLSTTCPATRGQKQTYHMDLFISKNYPIRTYDVKWKVFNPQEQECCFIFRIKLHK